MILKIVDWKAIWKFSVTICGLHFDRTSRISCKNMMKDIISDNLVFYWMCTTIKNTELLKGWRTVIR